MARSKGSANLAASLEVLAGAPLDARLVVNTKADLTAATSYPYKYIGMIVSVKNEQRAYMLVGNDTTVEDNWKVVGGDSLDVVVYRPAGSIFFADRPATLTPSLVGNVYYIKDDFTTTAEFVEGAGNDYSAGTSIYVINMGNETTPVLHWDVLSASIDLSKYQEKFQYGTLPTPVADIENYVFQYVGATNANYTNGYFYKCIENPLSAGTYTYIALDTQEINGVVKQLDVMPTPTEFDQESVVQYIGSTTANYTSGYFYECVRDPSNPSNFIWKAKSVQSDSDTIIQVEVMPAVTATDLNRIVQYIGATDSSYTNGYFYKCIEDPEAAGTYIWKDIPTQDGGSGSLGIDIIASVDVGGIKTGDIYPIGTNYDDMWQDLLDPIKYPTLTAPSATISIPGDKVLETGTTTSKTITATFNRGSINPAYGTDGYRAGAATSYSLNSGTAQAGNTFTQTISESNKTFKVTVAYAAGTQPKDSKGHNYDAPLPAGTVDSNTITYKFDNPIWANTSSISTVAKLGILDHTSTKQKDMNFPAQTVANPEIFDIPASWTVTAVQVKNDLSGQYEDCSSEFTVTNTTHNDAGGTSIAYKRYTDNRGYNAGARTIRVKWS